MAYIDIAREILKNNIKSAIYIDDNAREFYQDIESLKGAKEEELSLDLYSKFRESGVSLEPIKYVKDCENDENWINYCLENRDLILLDWQLQGQSGEIESLDMQIKITVKVKRHFCKCCFDY